MYSKRRLEARKEKTPEDRWTDKIPQKKMKITSSKTNSMY